MKKQAFLLYLLLYTLFLSATEKPTYITLTTEQGLTSNTINCIYKDWQNFIWIGTANGLNRFDGTDVLVFNNFKDKSVVAIAEADSSILYVLSEKELYQYNRKFRTNSVIKIETNENLIFKNLALDKNHNLYIITNSGLFSMKRGKGIASKIEDDKIQGCQLEDIYIDKNNVCWLTSDKGLIKYNINTKHTNIYTTNSSEKFSHLTKGENELYIGTSDSKIVLFDIEKNTFSHLISLDAAYIQTIKYHNKTLYVGTNGNGLKAINLEYGKIPQVSQNVFLPNSTSNTNAIYSIWVDDNSFWIGTFSGGISYIPSSRKIFNLFSDGKDFNTFGLNIRSLSVDSIGNGVYGTRSGLIYYYQNNVKYYNTDNTPNLKSNIILCIHPFGNNYLIGTYSGGLRLFEKSSKEIKIFKDDAIFKESSFYSIIQTKDNTIWFGTLSGLLKYNISDDTYKVFNTSNSEIISNDIYYILQDSSNRIWIATREGICYYEAGQIKKITSIDINSIGIVRYIYEDSNKNIWLGCENQGAIKIAKDLLSFKHYTIQNILPSNYVSSIIEDNFGQIWLTTPKGIILYKNDSEYSIFSLHDGIPGYAFNDGAVQKTSNNIIWWGNEKGLVFLNPSTIRASVSHKINITKVVIDGLPEDVNINRLDMAPEYLNTITLPANQKNLVFKFSDFEYNFPPTIIYEYKLEGVHDTWQKTLSGRDILIPNIPSGKYILKIREAGNNNSAKSIYIIKEKSYTLLWAVGAFISFIIIASIFYKRLIYKFRKEKKMILDNKKTDKVKYQNLKLEKDELTDIKQLMVKYMDEEKPYLDPNFKLDDIAQAINYPKTKISQVLNLHLNTNFSNFVSMYRIDAFKEKAKEGLVQQYTLSALAKDCGFSSRSSFFHSVKKLTGQTPAEFLKDAGINIDN